MTTTERPILYLLDAGFEDPAYPGQSFVCRQGSQVEGVLAHFPDVRSQLRVERVAFPRPRKVVIEAVGEANQGLPLLVLPVGESVKAASGIANGRAFAAGADAILATLAERHGLPVVHP